MGMLYACTLTEQADIEINPKPTLVVEYRYTDKNGNKRTAFEVVAEHVYFAESKKEGAQTGNAAPVQGTSGGFSIGDIGDYEEIETDGDLPF